MAAAGPALLIAALSNARAASSSVSWSLLARKEGGQRTIQFKMARFVVRN